MRAYAYRRKGRANAPSRGGGEGSGRVRNARTVDSRLRHMLMSKDRQEGLGATGETMMCRLNDDFKGAETSTSRSTCRSERIIQARTKISTEFFECIPCVALLLRSRKRSHSQSKKRLFDGKPRGLILSNTLRDLGHGRTRLAQIRFM